MKDVILNTLILKYKDEELFNGKIWGLFHYV